MLKIFKFNQNNSLRKLELFLDKRKSIQKGKSSIVKKIINNVKKSGDKAVLNYEKKFSKVKTKSKKIYFSNKELNKISSDTMVGGATLTKLLGTSAWYAPGASVSYLVDSILNDINSSKKGSWRIAILRYFNTIGAHSSSLIGENPLEKPNNIFPLIINAAYEQKNLKVFGKDWPTKDGTCIRDYIHVMDLASGHLAALDFLLNSKPQLLTLNLGTGKGTSVMQAVKAFEKISKRTISHKIVNRRSGDTAITIADASMAEKYLNWRAKRDLNDMCASSWNWQKTNPNGYHDN